MVGSRFDHRLICVFWLFSLSSIPPVPSLLDTETGTIRKKWKGRLPVALLYANAYEVAVSNLGWQVVYGLLNDLEEVVCERFVYPGGGEPLRSLESSRPLSDFPLVFGSISFEHDYPRLAAMLAVGGIPAMATERSEEVRPGQPIVVLGGVAVFMNPEPLAAFADLMVIGEAEPVLARLVGLLAGYGGCRRQELLARVGRSIPGCYAPGLYRFQYGAEGEVTDWQAEAGLPHRVARVVAADMSRAAHSTLSSPQAELGMHMVELGRGCSRGCRFCAAGFIYRPPRLWAADQVIAGLAARPEQQTRVGLLGMEMAEEQTLDRITEFLHQHSCALSFSSLRADRISDQTLSLLADSRLKSVAIAADGCSERLRRLINKGVDEPVLLDAAARLVEAGIFHLKLYVMIGLPTETKADLDELVTLVDRLQARILPIGRARKRMSELTLSINCFVPKPWTPFQYCSFGGLATPAEGDAGVRQALVALKEKIGYVRGRFGGCANLRLKFDQPEQALQQAVFARADRRIGPVLLAIGGGLPFRQAMRRHGLQGWSHAVRPRPLEERFCWEVVDHGIQSAYLRLEYRRAMRGELTPPCEPAICRQCGVCR